MMMQWLYSIMLQNTTGIPFQGVLKMPQSDPNTEAIQALKRVVHAFQVLYTSAEDFIKETVVSAGLPSGMVSTGICTAQIHPTQDG